MGRLDHIACYFLLAEIVSGFGSRCPTCSSAR